MSEEEWGMETIEPELRAPAPRPTRLRAGARRRFAVNLILFLLLGGLPIAPVIRQIAAFQALQEDGEAVEGTVLGRNSQVLFPGLRVYTLNCVYAAPSGRAATARVPVSRGWWLSSPPGSGVAMTVSEEAPGNGMLGGPGDLQIGDALGLVGSGLLLAGLMLLLLFGARMRPYFRDAALVALGTPVSGRVIRRTWRTVRRCGFRVDVPMVHLQFRDPFGVERVRTQVVDRRTWDSVEEGASMTVLVCCRRRSWFAAYPLLLAEGAPPRGKKAAG